VSVRTGSPEFYLINLFIGNVRLNNKHGPKVKHQVLLDFKAGKQFNETIEKQLSMTIDQLNDKLAGQLVRVFAEGN
jgi:hypothetical protein